MRPWWWISATRIPDASFDVVLCRLGLMYMPHPLTALREWRRPLRSADARNFRLPSRATRTV